MPRPLIGETAMTCAERQARYRAAHAAGASVIRIRRPADRRSRIRRWNDTIAGLVDLQAEYAEWLDALPDNQQDSATAEAPRAIVELDLSELPGDRAATWLWTGLNNGMAHMVWATIARGAIIGRQPVTARTAR